MNILNKIHIILEIIAKGKHPKIIINPQNTRIIDKKILKILKKIPQHNIFHIQFLKILNILAHFLFINP